MRIAHLPEGEGSRVVFWQHVCAVRYIAEGTRRFLVLTYTNGMERNLEIHQARDLWYQVEAHKGCASPCYFRHEGDTAPHSCMSCKLAEALEGVDCSVRPAPLPPRRLRAPDRRGWLIAGLVALLLVVLFGWANTLASLPSAELSPPPPPKVPVGASIKGERTHQNRGRGEDMP